MVEAFVQWVWEVETAGLAGATLRGDAAVLKSDFELANQFYEKLIPEEEARLDETPELIANWQRQQALQRLSSISSGRSHFGISTGLIQECPGLGALSRPSRSIRETRQAGTVAKQILSVPWTPIQIEVSSWRRPLDAFAGRLAGSR